MEGANRGYVRIGLVWKRSRSGSGPVVDVDFSRAICSFLCPWSSSTNGMGELVEVAALEGRLESSCRRRHNHIPS